MVDKQEGSKGSDDFELEARSERTGIVSEFIDFLIFNKKFWLIPILVVLMLLGLLIALAGTGAAPFIYTLF